VRIVHDEHRRGELVAVCEMPDSTHAVIPMWMLDRAACAALTIGPPRCSLGALRYLRQLLDVLVFDPGAPPQARVDQEANCDRNEDKRSIAGNAAATASASRTEPPIAKRNSRRGSAASRAPSEKCRAKRVCGRGGER
jgi:hypothetical protein